MSYPTAGGWEDRVAPILGKIPSERELRTMQHKNFLHTFDAKQIYGMILISIAHAYHNLNKPYDAQVLQRLAEHITRINSPDFYLLRTAWQHSLRKTRCYLITDVINGKDES